MAGSAPTLKFTVRRQPAVLVPPAAPTPRELKRLSDIDDQDGLRFHIPVIQFYRRSEVMGARDPVPVLRDAVAKALVHYYPFAGRLRELEGRKLAVECTGEGVLFIEADADVRLEQFGDALQPPFPCLDELIFDVPGSSEIVGSPLLLIQVTRLACGGFILALRQSHTMADAQGLVQFLGAVAELARGAASPSVRPVWERELLEAREPPRPAFAHPEYDEPPAITTTGPAVPPDDMVHRSFFFGRREVAAIRARLPPRLRSRATAFDAIAGCLWKCRTAALACPADAGAVMRMICISSARRRNSKPAPGAKASAANAAAIPEGYYGNAFALPAGVATAGELRANPLGFAVGLVRQAKRGVDAEYLRSVADLMALRGRPHFTVARAFLLSDVTKAGFGGLDFGWGRPAYGGPAKGSVGPVPGMASFLIATKGADGEDGVVVPMCLPGPAMDRFAEEMDKMLRAPACRSAL